MSRCSPGAFWDGCSHGDLAFYRIMSVFSEDGGQEHEAGCLGQGDEGDECPPDQVLLVSPQKGASDGPSWGLMRRFSPFSDVLRGKTCSASRCVVCRKSF